jgi:hypothetical protein
VVSRRVVSEKADTHAWPDRGPCTIPFPELIGIVLLSATTFPLMLR